MIKNKFNFIKILLVCLSVIIGIIFLTGCLEDAIPEYLVTKESEPEELQNTISVSGTGSISVVPDVVLVNISVVTQEATSEEAVNKNSEITKNVISAIEETRVLDLEVKTVSFNLSPLYEYFEEGEISKIYAYRITSTIEVQTSEIEKTGEIIADASEAGANNINSIRFDLNEQTRNQAKNDALSKATADANNKALAIANSLNLQLDKIFYISESGTYFPGPIYGMGSSETKMYAEQEIAPPPIMPEEIEVTAEVEIVFYFKQI